MKTKIFYPFLLMFLMTSCGAPTKQFVTFKHTSQLEEGKGRIYVIKPSGKASAYPTSIFCDNTLIGKAGRGSYLCWDMSEGSHKIGNTQYAHTGATLGAGKGEDILNINVKGGKTYYLKIVPHGSFEKWSMDFELISNEEGERLVKSRKKPLLNYVD